MLARFLLATCLFAVYNGAPAVAQSQPGASSETGTLINTRPASVNGRGKVAARQTSRQFATCAVRMHRATVEQLLRTPMVDPDYRRLLNRAVTDDCMGPGELRMTIALMRSALFESMYLARYSRRSLDSFNDIPAIDYRGGYGADMTPEIANVIQLGQFGYCVVRADPVATRAMVLSLPGSGNEDSALKALMPKLSRCVPKTLQISFSRSVLRGAVAEGLYRLTAASLGDS